MRYIAAEDVAKAKEMDLLTYLRNYEPQELVHVSGNTYCTREHDSLRISNGKWCWFSQGIGGRSALDYLIKVKGIPFTQAAEIILGREAEKPPVFYRQKERRSAELLMPELSETTERVEKYLYSRGIHPVIIRYCVENKLLFESADFHNAMFVGYDKDGKARYLWPVFHLRLQHAVLWLTQQGAAGTLHEAVPESGALLSGRRGNQGRPL